MLQWWFANSFYDRSKTLVNFKSWGWKIIEQSMTLKIYISKDDILLIKENSRARINSYKVKIYLENKWKPWKYEYTNELEKYHEHCLWKSKYFN